VYRALDIAKQALELRGSSLYYNLLIEKLNTKLLIVRIAIIRTLMSSYQMRSKSVLDYTQFRLALELLVFSAKVAQSSDF
jgi:hypothetical protein